MKKIKLLLVILLIVMLLPFNINAAKKNPITVHMFRGEGCGYCAAALEFFESIEDEYGKYFNLETHEVWYDSDNATLMSQVASYFGEDVGGVPYIIIGDKTFQGYAEQYNDEIKENIKSAYDSGNFHDIVADIQSGEIKVDVDTPSGDDNTKNTTTNYSSREKNEKSDKTTIIIIVAALVGFIALVYFARDSKDENEIDVEDKEVEKIVEESKNEEVKKTSTPKKTENAKKTSTTKKKTNTTKKSTSAKKTSKK